MSLETVYKIRYEIPDLQQRVEAAVMTAVQDVFNEDVGAPDHATRLAWAQWANVNTSVASMYFMWPLAMNPSVQTSVEADPSGQGVTDNDIQFVVNSALPKVIADCVANPPSGFNPPP